MGRIVVLATARCGRATSARRRQAGFWVFLLSNILWIAWGWHDGAWALIVLQFALAGLNLRGVKKNEPAAG